MCENDKESKESVMNLGNLNLVLRVFQLNFNGFPGLLRNFERDFYNV